MTALDRARHDAGIRLRSRGARVDQASSLGDRSRDGRDRSRRDEGADSSEESSSEYMEDDDVMVRVGRERIVETFKYQGCVRDIMGMERGDGEDRLDKTVNDPVKSARGGNFRGKADNVDCYGALSVSMLKNFNDREGDGGGGEVERRRRRGRGEGEDGGSEGDFDFGENCEEPGGGDDAMEEIIKSQSSSINSFVTSGSKALVSSLRAEVANLKREVSRIERERFESLAEIELMSDRQLSKAEGIASFYASLRTVPIEPSDSESEDNARKEYLISAVSDAMPRMVGADSVVLFIVEPPISLTAGNQGEDLKGNERSFRNDATFASDEPKEPYVDPCTKVWTCHAQSRALNVTLNSSAALSNSAIGGAQRRGQQRRAEVISAPITQGGIVGECAQVAKTINVEAGGKVDLAKTRGLRDTFMRTANYHTNNEEEGNVDGSFAINSSFRSANFEGSMFEDEDEDARRREEEAKFAVGMLCVPVVSASTRQVLGVLQAMGPRDASVTGHEVLKMFNSDSVACCEGVSRELGVILENIDAKERAENVSNVADILEHLWPVTSMNKEEGNNFEGDGAAESAPKEIMSLSQLTSDVEGLVERFYREDLSNADVKARLYCIPDDAADFVPRASPPAVLVRYGDFRAHYITAICADLQNPVKNALSQSLQSTSSLSLGAEVFTVNRSDGWLFDFSPVPYSSGFIVVSYKRRSKAYQADSRSRKSDGGYSKGVPSQRLKRLSSILPPRLDAAYSQDARSVSRALDKSLASLHKLEEYPLTGLDVMKCFQETIPTNPILYFNCSSAYLLPAITHPNSKHAHIVVGEAPRGYGLRDSDSVTLLPLKLKYFHESRPIATYDRAAIVDIFQSYVPFVSGKVVGTFHSVLVHPIRKDSSLQGFVLLVNFNETFSLEGDLGVALRPHKSLPSTQQHNSDKSDLPSLPPCVKSMISYMSGPLALANERAKKMRELEKSAACSSLGKLLNSVTVEKGCQAQSLRRGFECLRRRKLESNVESLSSHLSESEVALRQMDELKKSNADLLWKLDFQGKCHSLLEELSSFKEGAVGEDEAPIDKLSNTLSGLYPPGSVSLVPLSQLVASKNHVQIPSISSKVAALFQKRMPKTKDVQSISVRDSAREREYNAVVDGAGFKSFFFALLPLASGPIVLRIGKSAIAGFEPVEKEAEEESSNVKAASLESALLCKVCASATKASQEAQRKIEMSSIVGVVESFQSDFLRQVTDESVNANTVMESVRNALRANDMNVGDDFINEPASPDQLLFRETSDPLLNTLQTLMLHICASSSQKIEELTKCKKRANELGDRMREKEMADQRKKNISLRISAASSACAKCLSAVGEGGSARLLREQPSDLPTTTVDPGADGGVRLLMNTISRDEDVASVVNAATGRIQLFVTCKNWSGDGQNIRLKPQNSHPVFSVMLSDQFNLPWSDGLSNVVEDDISAGLSENGAKLIGGNLQKLLEGNEGNFLTIKDPTSDLFVGILLFESKDDGFLIDLSNNALRQEENSKADAKDLLSKTLVACIRRASERRQALQHKMGAREGEVFKKDLRAAKSELKKLANEKETIRTEFADNMNKLRQESQKANAANQRVKQLEAGRQELTEMRHKLNEETQHLSKRISKLDGEKTRLLGMLEGRAEECQKLRDGLSNAEDLLRGFDKTFHALNSIYLCGGSLGEVVNGLKDAFLKLFAVAEDEDEDEEMEDVCKVALLKVPADKNGVFDLSAEHFEGDALSEAMLHSGARSFTGEESGSGRAAAMGRILQLVDADNPHLLLGIVEVSPNHEKKLQSLLKCSIALCAFSSTKILKIHAGEDIELLKFKAAYANGMDKMFGALFDSWNDDITENPYDAMNFRSESLNALHATIAVLERAALKLLEGSNTEIESAPLKNDKEPKFAVKVYLTGGTTGTGLPALTSVTGEVIPIDPSSSSDRSRAFLPCIENCEEAVGPRGELYVPIRFKLSPYEIQNRSNKHKRNCFRVGGVIVFESFNRDLSDVEIELVRKFSRLIEPTLSSAHDSNESKLSLNAAVGAIATLRSSADSSEVSETRAKETVTFLQSSLSSLGSVAFRCVKDKSLISNEGVIFELISALAVAVLKNCSGEECTARLIETRHEFLNGANRFFAHSRDGENVNWVEIKEEMCEFGALLDRQGWRDGMGYTPKSFSSEKTVLREMCSGNAFCGPPAACLSCNIGNSECVLTVAKKKEASDYNDGKPDEMGFSDEERSVLEVVASFSGCLYSWSVAERDCQAQGQVAELTEEKQQVVESESAHHDAAAAVRQAHHQEGKDEDDGKEQGMPSILYLSRAVACVKDHLSNFIVDERTQGGDPVSNAHVSKFANAVAAHMLHDILVGDITATNYRSTLTSPASAPPSKAGRCRVKGDVGGVMFDYVATKQLNNANVKYEANISFSNQVDFPIESLVTLSFETSAVNDDAAKTIEQYLAFVGAGIVAVGKVGAANLASKKKDDMIEAALAEVEVDAETEMKAEIETKIETKVETEVYTEREHHEAMEINTDEQIIDIKSVSHDDVQSGKAVKAISKLHKTVYKHQYDKVSGNSICGSYIRRVGVNKFKAIHDLVLSSGLLLLTRAQTRSLRKTWDHGCHLFFHDDVTGEIFNCSGGTHTWTTSGANIPKDDVTELVIMRFREGNFQNHKVAVRDKRVVVFAPLGSFGLIVLSGCDGWQGKGGGNVQGILEWCKEVEELLVGWFSAEIENIRATDAKVERAENVVRNMLEKQTSRRLRQFFGMWKYDLGGASTSSSVRWKESAGYDVHVVGR